MVIICGAKLKKNVLFLLNNNRMTSYKINQANLDVHSKNTSKHAKKTMQEIR